ncbi:hypothetical protein ACU5AX_09110 [Sphingomonas sp. XXL09]|uniref:hypothetical protein n=1 Tax=Sphingomonas sp. XXL09 TaxID=3457787 RepID=UPI00406BC2F3
MTGADIVGALLRDYAALVEEVPIERIKGGRLPANIALPALLVRTISSAERQRLRRGDTTRTNDRVSVTVRASSWDEQIRILDLVVEACADRTGSIEGATNYAVLTAGRGPDMDGPGDSFEQAQDFRASFDKPNPRGD